jgi:hypothetical protein
LHRWRADGFKSGCPEYGSIRSLGYFNYQRLISPDPVEIFVEFQPQLPGVDAYGAIFERTVPFRLVKEHFTDVLFRQFMSKPADCLLRNVLKQIA